MHDKALPMHKLLLVAKLGKPGIQY